MSDGCIVMTKKDPSDVGNITMKEPTSNNCTQKRICAESEYETNSAEDFYGSGGKILVNPLYDVRSKETYYAFIAKVVIKLQRTSLNRGYNTGEKIQITRRA